LLLVANGVLREVYGNFKLVGHTHDDMDVLFGQWNMKLRKHNYPTIPLFMKSFINIEL
jgi:Na+-translocating ferredoxin:NAD+ oxidoreductase RnfE subunit